MILFLKRLREAWWYWGRSAYGAGRIRWKTARALAKIEYPK